MDVFDLMAKIDLDTKDYDSKLKESKSKLSGLKDGIGKIGGLLSSTAKVAGAALTAASVGVAKITKQSLDAYGSYEQLKGGVETLFGDSAQKVLANSEQAFKTAGMSMNEYMETSIQSAAALINSLDGDTAKAADLMDVSITDMADNVNKMGTTMEAVQNAYRGFSRGNFTMLDNLALGFSGTKEGMQQLLDKAKEISGVEFDISSYSDIVQAIHVVQEEMGVSGTTAKEAADTIQGSLLSTQAAWENLVTNLARDDADISGLVDTLVSSIENTASNVIPRLEIILGGIGDLVVRLAPVIGEKLPVLVETIAPSLLTAATTLIEKLAENLPLMLGSIWTAIRNAFDSVGFGNIVDAMDRLKTAVTPLVSAIADLVTNETVVETATTLFNVALEVLTSTIEIVASILTEAIGIVSDFVTWLDSGSTGAEALKVVIIAITAAIVAYNAVMTILEAKAKLAAAAQVLLNIAMSMNPIGLVVALIAGLVAAFVVLWNKCEGFRNFWKAAWEGIKSVFTGFVEAWKAGVQTIKGWIDKTVNFVKDLASSISSKTKETWNNIQNIIWKAMDAIKTKIDKVKEIKDIFVGAFQTAVDFIKGLPAKALQWGKDLIDNFVGGIKEKAGAVVEGVKGVANSVKSFLGFSEPEKGPLSNFHTFAPDMMQLFAQGIDKGKVDVLSSVKGFADDIAGYMAMDDYSVGASYSGSVSRSDTTANAGISYAGATININVSGVDTKDPRSFAERIAEELATLTSDNNSRMGAWAL